MDNIAIPADKLKDNVIICENAEEILKAINAHPDAVLHLTKRQIRRLGGELSFRFFRQIKDGFNYGSSPYKMNDDGTISPKEGYSFLPGEVMKQVIDSAVSKATGLLAKELQQRVDSLIPQWMADGSINSMIEATMLQSIRDCGNKLISFAIKREENNEQ